MMRFIRVLTIVCVVAALILGITYNVTKPLIAEQKEKEKQEALKEVLPDADEYKEGLLDDKQYYEGYKNGKPVGYAISCAGDGYAGEINMLVGIDSSGKITGVEVLSQQETPGLGARCIEIKPKEKKPWFLAQLEGRPASELDRANIEAITGATITTEAIIKAIKEEVAAFFDKVKK